MQQSTLLREQNYQLKNQISQLKNAFDLNRDILKILSQNCKSTQPKNQIFFQIINRLTAINNQVMINAAQLIQQKNKFKQQSANLQRQNELLKERIQQFIEKQLQQHNRNSNSVKQIHFYLQNKIISLQKQNRSLDEELIIKEHQLLKLRRDLQFYQQQNNKKSIIPTIDKSYNKVVISNQLPVPFKAVPRKYSFSKQDRFQQKISKLQKQVKSLNAHIEQIQYRLLVFIKLYDIQDSLIPKMQQKNIRKCLQQQYHSEMVQLRLLKFATNNLIKNQKHQSQSSNNVFTVLQTTKRNRGGPKHQINKRYRAKSLQVKSFNLKQQN